MICREQGDDDRPVLRLPIPEPKPAPEHPEQEETNGPVVVDFTVDFTVE